jgi:hypothetical protein
MPVSRQQAAPRPQTVVNLVDALRRSVAQETAASTRPKKSRKCINAQGEMLPAISGKKGRGPAGKCTARADARRKRTG